MTNINDQILEKEDRVSISLLKSTFSEFEKFLQGKYKEEYSTFSDEEKIKKFEIIFSQALKIMKNDHKNNLLEHIMWDGKIARIDVVKKIGYIMWELKQYPSFPRIPPMTLRSNVKKIIGKDPRYFEKYSQCILNYSNFEQQMNYVDVSKMYQLLPEDLIIKKIFWGDI